jgi:dynactin-4
MWTSLDVGIKFDKPTNIRAQLTAFTRGTEGQRPSKDAPATTGLKSAVSAFGSSDDPEAVEDDGDGGGNDDDASAPPAAQHNRFNHSSRFQALKAFYRNQIAETSSSPSDSFMGPELGGYYSSPNALNRIMSLYTSGVSSIHGGGKKPKSKPPVMREALTEAEGLHVPHSDAEEALIRKMALDGWEGIASREQRRFQRPGTRFVDDLLPLPVLLRTKRSKRCKACKHILVKPEFKPQSTRFRIRLIALSYIPLTSLRPLLPLAPSPPLSLEALEPQKPVQFLLTLKNHMFDPIRVTLATPPVTPGRVETKVTILCPQFEVGANTDVWDEALQSGNMPDPRSSRSGFEKVAEAGKVWDKGRNWTTVAMEVVPGDLRSLIRGSGPIWEDEDVLEIPVFVRLEWEGEAGTEDVGSRAESKKHQAELVKREVAYWTVLGVGRISRAT